jgi:signal transduction histidine kinase
VADAAHELRSPLTAVRLELQLLDRAPDEEARREARANLGAAVERAIHLVEQLLTLARSDPREEAGAWSRIPLEQAAANGIADANSLAQARRIDLSLEAEPAFVQGDPEALRILVRNLVDNAVRYSPEGGQVRVSTHDRASGAALEVVDTGPGIPLPERERAFDRFYRRSNAPAGGSGLGLAIVKAIADRHGAQIRLDDAPGGGLKVIVAFPRPGLRDPGA